MTADIISRSANDQEEQIVTTSLIHGELVENITKSKETIFKLIEHNKQLKKEIESISQETEK